MFTRIVKMEFKEEKVLTFLDNFEKIKEKIRAFEGCTFLELYQDKNNKDIFFTYSRWENESDLENYRTSDLFKSVWATTKPMFRCKAQAWSVDTLHSLK
jgi:autoinducer 2-degrading protein